MNEEFLQERARAVRSIAANADPFTKKRLLDLADRYEGINQRRPLTRYKLPRQDLPTGPDGVDR
jgi:hypothetical protein